MSYNNFLLTNANISFRLEIDFGTGFEDITDYFLSYSNIEAPIDDPICGLIKRQIQVRLELPTIEVDMKWARSNLPIRLYISANGFEELAFSGVTTAEASISENGVELDVIENSEKTLHRKFGSDVLDLYNDWTFEASPTTNTVFESDGKFLPEGVSDEFGAVSVVNYRPKPASLTTRQDIRCNALFNYVIEDGEIKVGEITINQMLKAMGVFGGYDKDGVFHLKKRPWNNNLETWDFTNLVYFDSFRSIKLNSDFIFNSIDLKGYRFRHLLNLNNAFTTTRAFRKSNEIVGQELENGSNPVFLNTADNFNNTLFTEIKTGFVNVKANETDEMAVNSLTSGVHLSPVAYPRSLLINEGQVGTVSHSSYNFSEYPQFTIEGWVRIPSNADDDLFLVSNRDGSNNGQSLRFDTSARRIRFVNHGLENSDSNNNFYNFNEWFHFALVIDQTSKTARFYNNAKNRSNFVYSTTLSSSTGALTIGGRGGIGDLNFNGRVSELRFHKRALRSQDIERFYRLTKPDVPEIADNLFAYFDFNSNSLEKVQNQSLTWTGSPVYSSNNPIELRDYNGDRSLLTSFGNDNFNQTLKIDVNNSNPNAFLKEISVNSRGVYQKINDIQVNANKLLEGDSERKKELSSFYINDESYASELAENLLKVYGNEEGVFNFKIPHQPRLMVGDIIRFNTFFGIKKGQVLEKSSNINKESGFTFIDTILVKALDDLEVLFLADKHNTIVTNNNDRKIQIQ